MAVLVSYVPTPEGFAALAHGINEASRRGTSVLVANVAIGDDYSHVTFADEKDLDAVRASIASAGLTAEVRQITGASDVADEILKLADDNAVDLIVVGLRRRSTVGKMLLGSNAQQIILSASCPVLSVRPDPV